VWIHNGELKIIPLQEFTAHDPPPLALADALSHIRSAVRSEGTTATLFTDSDTNAAIQGKIKGFPRELQEQRHLARVMIPRLLAQIIHRNQQVIAPGVQSFYTRTTQFKVRSLPPFVLIVETSRIQLLSS
jgi:SGT1 protein